MIDAVLSKISRYLFLTDEGKQNWNKYEALHEYDGWKVHQGLLIEIMNQVSTYMLNSEFTKLDKEEKDVQQRAFYIVKEVIDFMLNPLKNAQRYVALQDAANKQGKGSPRKVVKEPRTQKGE